MYDYTTTTTNYFGNKCIPLKNKNWAASAKSVSLYPRFHKLL